jgi:hypothetical protein
LVSHTLRLPGALASQAGLPSTIPCTGATARDAVADACRSVPALSHYLTPVLDGSEWGGRLFVGARMVADPAQDLLHPGAELRVVLPAAGG